MPSEAAIERLGLVATDGAEANERSPETSETGGHAHTSYVATDRASALLAELGE